MTFEEFEEMEGDYRDMGLPDRKLAGFNKIAEYVTPVVCGADHDIIYSVGISELIEANITKEDAQFILDCGFFIQDDYLSVFT